MLSLGLTSEEEQEEEWEEQEEEELEEEHQQYGRGEDKLEEVGEATTLLPK